MPAVGSLSIKSSDTDAQFLSGGLSERGFIEGRNVGIEHRYAQGQPNRLPSLAADLARRQVAIIVTTGAQAALAAKGATTSIPIVFSNGSDPIRVGLVQVGNGENPPSRRPG
jgi:putative tryptophan/tyrosine transport system substrate-binding protein